MQVQTMSMEEASKRWAEVTEQIKNYRNKLDAVNNARIQTNDQISKLRKGLRELLLRSKKLQTLVERGRIKTKEGLVLVR